MKNKTNYTSIGLAFLIWIVILIAISKKESSPVVINTVPTIVITPTLTSTYSYTVTTKNLKYTTLSYRIDTNNKCITFINKNSTNLFTICDSYKIDSQIIK